MPKARASSPTRAADPSVAGDSHRLARQLAEWRLAERKVGLAGPLAGPDGIRMKRDVMAQLEEQGENILGDREGAVLRDVRDGDSPATGCSEIHAVEARGRDRDEPELRQDRDQIPRGWVTC